MTADREPSASANGADEANPYALANRLQWWNSGEHTHRDSDLDEASTLLRSLASRVSALTAERDNINRAYLSSYELGTKWRNRAELAEAELAKAREAAIEECTKKIEAVSQACVHESWSYDGSTNAWEPPNESQACYVEGLDHAVELCRALKAPREKGDLT